MKKIFSNTITLLAEVAALILGVIWFYNTREYEPLILIILSFGSLVTTWILRTKELPNIEVNLVMDAKGQNPVMPSSKTPKNEEGIPVLRVGNAIGRREIYWDYIVRIINNSTVTAFKPELYVIDWFKNSNFIGSLNIDTPISGEDRVELGLRFTKWTDGTPQEREKDFTPMFPNEITNELKLIVKYQTESGDVVFVKFEFKNGEKINSRVRKIPKNYSKAKIFG
jgi:hypothetical protein